MMEQSKTYLNKLLWKCDDAASADLKCFIYVQSKWSEDYVDFVLHESKSNKCYKGKLSKEDIQESATELEVPFDEFYDEVQSALTANISAPGFEYEIDETEGLFQLTKKQEFDIQYVEIKLREVRNNFAMLDTAIEVFNGEQKACTQQLENEVKNDKNFQDLKEAYEQILEEKNTMERKLLKKCALLLNTKKEKIAELQEKLDQLNGGIDPEEAEEDVDEMDTDAVVETSPPKRSKNSRKPLVTCKGNSSRTIPSKSNNNDDEKDNDNADFMAQTQEMTQLDDTTIELLPSKRNRKTKLRILDETTDDLILPNDDDD